MSDVKPRKLTVKQKKFVKAYVANDGNGTQAALATYNTVDKDTASAIAVENLGKPSIKEAIELALVKHDITIESAIKPIADGLRAVKFYEVNDDGAATGQPDHSIRLKASGMALKLMGAEQKAEAGGNTFLINNASFNSGKYTNGD